MTDKLGYVVIYHKSDHCVVEEFQSYQLDSAKQFYINLGKGWAKILYGKLSLQRIDAYGMEKYVNECIKYFCDNFYPGYQKQCPTCKGAQKIIKVLEFSFVPGPPLHENFNERLRHHCGPHYKNGFKWKYQVQVRSDEQRAWHRCWLWQPCLDCQS